MTNRDQRLGRPSKRRRRKTNALTVGQLLELVRYYLDTGACSLSTPVTVQLFGGRYDEEGAGPFVASMASGHTVTKELTIWAPGRKPSKVRTP